jgi:23S rRNA (cytosine1962-C5)-methyltransferase
MLLDYELLDFGEGFKLERFGDVVLQRPDPLAKGKRSLKKDEWKRLTNAIFVSEGQYNGQWDFIKTSPSEWDVKLSCLESELKLVCRLTKFKHIGLFPEQIVHWEQIFKTTTEMGGKPSMLNLFAYTGAASLVGSYAGADVTHVDAMKQLNEWAAINGEKNNLSYKRIVEDARKFVKREIRRQRKYGIVVLDPPAFGHGANSEKWILENDLPELLSDIKKIVLNNAIIIMSLYSSNISEYKTQKLLSKASIKYYKLCEMSISTKDGRTLPTGYSVTITI